MCEPPKRNTCKNKKRKSVNGIEQPISPSKSVNGVDQPISPVEVTKERPFICTFDNCNKSYMKSSQLKKHKNTHGDRRPFICTFDNCNKSYMTSSHLKRHEDTHGDSYRCTEKNCKQYFKTKATLKKHVDNIHLKKKPKTYKCSRCDQEFNKHNWLTRHQFDHTGIEPYLCPEEGCEKRFLLPSRLKRHLKMHQGYTCSKENCGQKFTKWTLYRKHFQIAHPPMHRCHYCEKLFTTSNNLKAHLEGHEFDREVYLCPKPNCSRFYFMKKNLTYHLKVYHEQRPFVCTEPYCYRAFKSKEDLNTHASRHDPNKRIRKKKKSNPKPSFAARLAGYVPRKTVKHKTDDGVASEKSLVNSKEKVQAICDASIEGNNQDVSDLNSTDDNRSTCDKDCIQTVLSNQDVSDLNSTDDNRSTCDKDCIQTVLSVQETMLERKSYHTESAICISA